MDNVLTRSRWAGAILRSRKDSITRLEQLWREFKSRGLHKNAIQFQVTVGNGIEWAGLDKLQEMKSAE
jgi:hypothetical protein